jgi:hypothetical protein
MAAPRRDILIDDAGNYLKKGGDFYTGYSDGQHGQLLLMSTPGSFRQSPLTGIGIRRMINAKLTPLGKVSLQKDITQQFQNDGYQVNTLSIPDTEHINIDYDLV